MGETFKNKKLQSQKKMGEGSLWVNKEKIEKSKFKFLFKNSFFLFLNYLVGEEFKYL